MGKTPRSRWIRSVAVVAAAGLVLTACGSSSDTAQLEQFGAGTRRAGDRPRPAQRAAARHHRHRDRARRRAAEPAAPVERPTRPAAVSPRADLRRPGLLRRPTATRRTRSPSRSSPRRPELHIKLKEGWKFTNGEPVTATSFVDAWNYARAGDQRQLHASFFDPDRGLRGRVRLRRRPTPTRVTCTKPAPTAETMSGLKVVSDTEFTVKLVSPQADFPLRLGYTAYYPMAKAALADIEDRRREARSATARTCWSSWDHNASIKLGPEPGLHRARRKAAERRRRLHVLHQLRGGLHRPAGRQPRRDQHDPAELAEPASRPTWATGRSSSRTPAPPRCPIPVSLDALQLDDEGKLRRAAISMPSTATTSSSVIFNGTRTPAADFAVAGHRRLLATASRAARC